MSEKWLEPDEYILLEGKVWASVWTLIGPGNSKAKVYLTNKRLYGKDAWTGLKMFDFPLSAVTKIEERKKNLHIEANLKGKKKRISLRLKDKNEDWEWMIRERIKMLKK